MSVQPRILCIGCSWTRVWPRKLPYQNTKYKLTKKAMDGHGLNDIYNHLKHHAKKFDDIIVQLPTPIRSFRDRFLFSYNTGNQFKNFIDSWNDESIDVIIDKTSFKKRAIEDLLRKYKNTILKINELHPNVHFFLYNTGGYPFRHPFDFGETIDKDMIDWFKYKDIKHIYLTLENKPGFCTGEQHDVDDEYREYAMKQMSKKALSPVGHKNRPELIDNWVAQHPPHCLVLNAHPNDNGDNMAAETVQKYLEKVVL